MVGIETDMCGLTRNSRLRQELLDAQLLVAAIAVGTFDLGCQVAVFPARRARTDIGDAEPEGERGGVELRGGAGDADAAHCGALQREPGHAPGLRHRSPPPETEEYSSHAR